MSRARSPLTAVALAAGLVVAAAAPVHAQQQIAIGQSVSGALTVSDLQWSDGARYDPYIFFGQAGQLVTILMTSTDFDSYLILQDQNGNQVAFNDDGGGGLNAQISQALPFTGTYRVIAKAYARDRYGNYMLTIGGSGAVAMNTPTPIAAPTAIVSNPNQLPAMGTIGANQQVTGNLTPADQHWDNKPIQLWSFACNAGQALEMDILSTWDNYGLLFDPMGNIVARDDDTGEGLNARISYVCTVAGIYRLGITAYSPSTQTGAYTLQVISNATTAAPTAIAPVAAAAAAPTPIPMPGNTMPAPATQAVAITGSIPAPGAIGQIAVGQNVQGRLESGDQRMDDGSWADVWQFQGTAGQHVHIELRSDEFDTYAQLLDASGTRLAENDDISGDNRNSMIDFTLPRAGMYQIVVNNFSEDRRTGIYTLSLQ